MYWPMCSFILAFIHSLQTCVPGYYGRECQSVCEAGTFGAGDREGCPDICHCATSSCAATDGVCETAGCQSGYLGAACDQSCTDGKSVAAQRPPS